ncbi:MAG: hypothetical protein KDE33_12840 [Bacteroidetes bacterium]|nr:hypothetical protein [Bacteroidota bacterium]
MSIDKFESGRKTLETLIQDFKTLNIEKFNEADTRFRFIDEILTECLNWEPKDINNEDVKDGHYADYKLNLFRPVAVWEAKRTGNYFELPVGTSKLIMPLKTICKDNPSIKDALNQVSGYCHERGIKIGVVSNGWQIIAFVANRNDSVPPLDGDGLVIPSLEFFLANYKEVWNCLSKNGFQEDYITNKLIGGAEEQLPPKLSSTITQYPGIKNRNPFQVELEIISDLVLEDVIKEKSIEKEFLKDCYCKSGSLSQYSLLSKQILSTRYSYLFEGNDKKAVLEQIATKKGLSSDLVELFANSLSKRPILLIGDVGVGKSTFIDNLLLVEAPTVFEKAITFKIDLGSKAIISFDLKEAILKIIKQQLLDLYKIDISEDNFVRHAYFIELENFKSGVTVKRLYDVAPIQAVEKEIEFLTNLIKVEAEHLKKSLEYICKNQKKQIIIFIDNCDQRNDIDQETAFLIAQELAADWSTIVFVCLRPETFHRTKKKEGALSGYHPKAFTIAPPRIDDVINRRLSFAQKITRGEIALSKLNNTTSFSKLDILIQCFIDSLKSNKALFTFFENVSNGNIRKAIELIKKFFGSGHVNTEKILGFIESTGKYTIPVHEILRSVIYGDNEHYNPINSEITNLFDVRANAPKDHFTIPLILGLLQDYSINNRNEGFVSIKEIYAYMQKLGYLPITIDLALNSMYSKELFETSEKGNYLNTDKDELMLRATGTGIYHLSHLINNFTYIDAIIVDVPFFEKESREKITNTFDIKERLERAIVFADYLDIIWDNEKFNNTHFVWKQKSQELRADIERIKSRIQQH